MAKFIFYFILASYIFQVFGCLVNCDDAEALGAAKDEMGYSSQGRGESDVKVSPESMLSNRNANPADQSTKTATGDNQKANDGGGIKRKFTEMLKSFPLLGIGSEKDLQVDKGDETKSVKEKTANKHAKIKEFFNKDGQGLGGLLGNLKKMILPGKSGEVGDSVSKDGFKNMNFDKFFKRGDDGIKSTNTDFAKFEDSIGSFAGNFDAEGGAIGGTGLKVPQNEEVKPKLETQPNIGDKNNGGVVTMTPVSETSVKGQNSQAEDTGKPKTVGSSILNKMKKFIKKVA